MNYLWGAVNAISAPYQYYKDINPATLTGAIDVIVVRRPTSDGTTELVCSPFHVRFGKWQVLRPSEKKVDVTVNGKTVPFSMKIGEAGEAFFVFETEGEVPDELITSPILEPTQPGQAAQSVGDAGRFGAGKHADDAATQEPEFFDLDAASTAEPGETSGEPMASGISPGGPDPQRSNGNAGPVQVGKAAAVAAVELEKDVIHKAQDSVVAARDVARSVFADPHEQSSGVSIPEDLGDEALPKVNKEDLSTPTLIDNGDVLIDMGGYHSGGAPNSRRENELVGDSDEKHISHSDTNAFPTFSTSRETPNLASPSSQSLSHLSIPFPNMRAPSAPPSESLHHAPVLPSSSIPSEDYSWEWGGFPQRSPMSVQFPTLSKPVPLGSIAGAGNESRIMTDEPVEFHRSKSLPPEFELELSEEPPASAQRADRPPQGEPLSDAETDYGNETGTSGHERRSWVRWWRRNNEHPGSVDTAVDRPPLKGTSSAPLPREPKAASTIDVPTPDERARDPSMLPSPASLADMAVYETSPSPIDSGLEGVSEVRYAKTLRLTSEQLQSLELQPGANTMTFSLSMSGVVACTARIFLWEDTDSVVVSDIDGTITKSDALGHMFTLIGRDWTHLGVAKLYTDICKNGYKIMYLTSRAIGQADSTRYYLQGIKQNDYQLPEGPVIMSPDRLMASLHREVIMRKPEVFKMACLRDIQRLFGPTTPRPFYAGFGNRITDALSYRSVNIPSSRIFTIDTNGEVKMELLELAGYRSPSVQSYIHMTDLVDQMFPPITHKWESAYTDNNYWKAPLPEFPLPDLTPPSPALSARSDTSNQSTLARLRNFSLRSTSTSRSRSFAPSPPPATDPSRGRNMNGVGSHTHQRQLSSIERLSNAFVGLASGSVSPGTPSRDDSDSEGERESSGGSDTSERRRRLRKRSTRSMPGSLPGSRPSSDEEDLEFGVPVKGIYPGAAEQETEVAEQEFDEDLFAAVEDTARWPH
ncbi:Lipin/Ned1/Smp2-domain-containing protein [Gloeopeniophorella convolvens]|nr:Lipin/Ned1/Smp2-domain-containing protein [Gloeopeniophorella convolvens]